MSLSAKDAGNGKSGTKRSLNSEFILAAARAGVTDLAEKTGIIQNDHIPQIVSYEGLTPPLRARQPISGSLDGLEPTRTDQIGLSNSLFGAVSQPEMHTSSGGAGIASSYTAFAPFSSPGGVDSGHATSTAVGRAPQRAPMSIPATAFASQQQQQSQAAPPEPRPEESQEMQKSKKRKTGGTKQAKGLKHFSVRVCEKLRQKKQTTLNEVATELAREMKQVNPDLASTSNIQRRIYDALNVLLALNIIRKEKKTLTWLGVPKDTDEELKRFWDDREALLERLRRRKNQLKEMKAQHAAFLNLVERNADEYYSKRCRSVKLPFIVISTPLSTDVKLEVTEDRSTVFFEFSSAFEIHDDNEILRELGFSGSSPAVKDDESDDISTNAPVNHGSIKDEV